MFKQVFLNRKPGSVVKRQTSQTASDCEWLQTTTRDYEWLRARLQVTASQTMINYAAIMSEKNIHFIESNSNC